MAGTLGAQLPYVDVFKLCRVEKWPAGGDFLQQGDTRLEVDRTVGRIVRLTGVVPGANSLQLPARRNGCLGLTGRFLYIQAQLVVSKPYAIHVEFVTRDKNVHRLSISNLGKQDDARMRRSGIHVYMPAEEDSWLLLALDMHALAAQGCRAAFSKVRGVQLCANMAVHAVFTSKLKYGWESLPRDLAPSAAFDKRHAKVVWMPEEPAAGTVQLPAPRQPAAHPLPAVPKQPVQPMQPELRRSSRDNAVSGGTSSCNEAEQLADFALEPDPIMQLEHMNTFSGEFSRAMVWANDEIVFPAGSTIITMRAGSSNDGGGGHGSCSHQRHLLCHSRPVVALALDGSGTVMASAEEGSEGSIKLWDLAQGKCFATLAGHTGGIICLDLSPDGGRLVSAGVDGQGKQVVLLRDVAQCRTGGTARELALHTSDYNIKCAKFVPFEPDKVVACGKNSIRIYRLKDGQLRGVSVPMDGVQALRKPYSCGTLADPACVTVGEVFTDLAFEHNPQLLAMPTRRAFVATFSGALYQINLDMRVVEAVYQLHDAAITSVTLRHGFCFTGCGRGLLRIWGLDFGEVFLEAQLEGPVTSVAVSLDGLAVAAGTETGTLGILSVTSHKYTTLLRSHIDDVHAVAVEPSGQQFYTASADGTVRAWDSATRHQLMEFLVQKEKVLCIACHPTKAEVACGFDSGAVRVFDVGAAELAQECRQHMGAVQQVAYAQRGHVLLSAGKDGNVCAYDAKRSYLPLRYISLGPGLVATAIAVSQDGHTVAIAAIRAAGGGNSGSRNSSDSGQAITLFSAASLDPTLQFPLLCSGSGDGSRPPEVVARLHLLPDGAHVLAVSADGRLTGYSCCDGRLVLRLSAPLHGSAAACTASALDKSGSFLVTGGADGVVKVWGLHALHVALLEQQQQQQPACRGPDALRSGSGAVGGSSGVSGGGSSLVIKALPCQSFVGHPKAVLGLAFLSSRELISVGAGDALCFWSFLGQRCNAYPQLPRDATSCTVVIGPPPAGDSAAAAVATADEQHQSTQALAQPKPLPGLLEVADQGSAAPGARLQLQHRRASSPGSLGPGLAALSCTDDGRFATAAAAAAAAATAGQTSHGAATRAMSTKQPFWEQGPQGPFKIQVTAGPTSRAAQLVPLQPELRVTAPTPGSKDCKKAILAGPTSTPAAAGERDTAAPAAARSASWVWEEQPGARLPAYRPEEQLQLMPPSAVVQHVYGFSAAAGFGWNFASGRVAFAAGNVLLWDNLSNEQRLVACHASRISAMACSAAGGWLAAAVEPSEASDTAAAADIHLYDMATHQRQFTLQYHQAPATALYPSPDGSWLVSVGSHPELLAMWNTSTGELVAADSADTSAAAPAAAITAVSWLPGAKQPTLYTVSTDGGLSQWVLGPTALAAEKVVLPEAMAGAQMQAAACFGPPCADGGATLVLGDSKGCVWLVEVSGSLDITSFALLAELQKDSIRVVHCTAAAMGSATTIALGTDRGMLAVLQRQQQLPGGEGDYGSSGSGWELAAVHQLDGKVYSIGTQQLGGEALLVGTEASTLWLTHHGSAEVLLCGHKHSINSMQHAPGILATSSLAGLHVWQLSEQSVSPRAPILEFLEPDASCVSIARDCSCVAAGFPSGAVTLFDLEASCLRWRVLPPVQPVAGVAMLQQLRTTRIMVVYRNGAIYILDGSTGKVLQHTLQYLVSDLTGGGMTASAGAAGAIAPAPASGAGVSVGGGRPSQNFPISGLLVCPADGNLFALLGRGGRAVICKATWAKHSGCQTLARLQPPMLDTERAAAGGGAQQEQAPAVAFSSAHPGHVYCAFPSQLHQPPAAITLHDCASGGGAVVKTIPVAAALASGGAITTLAAGPGDSLLAAGCSCGSVLLMRGDTEAWSLFAGHGGSPVQALAFSRCGTKLFSQAGDTVFVWDIGA